MVLQRGDRGNPEDKTLRELARAAMAQFRRRLEASALAGKSKSLSFEQRTDGEFTLTSSGVLPCTACELTHALSPDNTDRWNASMIEMFGSDFAYGVKVRTIAMLGQSSHHESVGEDTHLSIKMAHFSGSIPLLSKKTTTFFLDYVESETNASALGPTTRRVVQTVKRDASGALFAGDVVAGYHLQEDRAAQHTLLFYHASHTANKLRDSSVQRLQKLGALVTKAGDLVLRRRLGEQQLIDPPHSSLERSSLTRSFISSSASASASASHRTLPAKALEKKTGDDVEAACATCDSSLTGLLKRKSFCRVCGQVVCGSCVKTREAEYRIGLITKVRVCTACLDRLQAAAFALPSDDE
ncbi:hypothetical protein BBJ28_00011732 [Nothophytophthora sp. Chile5]|nr:hypothetical protein BBJ28_00011732 [Nothophytophthora sp. Chile5]